MTGPAARRILRRRDALNRRLTVLQRRLDRRPSYFAIERRLLKLLARMDAMSSRTGTTAPDKAKELAELDRKARVAEAKLNIAKRRYQREVYEYQMERAELPRLAMQLEMLIHERMAQVAHVGLSFGPPFFKREAYDARLEALRKRVIAWRDLNESSDESWPALYAALETFARDYPPGATAEEGSL